MRSPLHANLLIPILAIILLASACNLPGKPQTSPQPDNTASPGPSATLTRMQNTQTPVIIPENTNTPLPMVSQTPMSSRKSIQLKVFLVALEDKGVSGKGIGCGDSAIPVTLEIPFTTGVLRAALTELLSIEEQYYGESGLYNALYQSNLVVSRISLENGEAVIHLEGDLKLGGVCDNPRLQAQLEETTLQFSTVQRARFFINDVPLENLLSGK